MENLLESGGGATLQRARSCALPTETQREAAVTPPQTPLRSPCGETGAWTAASTGFV